MFKVWPAAGFEAGCEAGFRKAARALQVIVRFATDLIAAKPVKPCDGGVFGALNLLSEKEQGAPGEGGRVWGEGAYITVQSDT